MNQTSSTLHSARIRRRHFRFSQPRLPLRLRKYGQALFLGVWVLVGLSTYGLAWRTFRYPASTVSGNTDTSNLEEDASFFFSSLSNSKQAFQTKRKHITKDETSKRLRKQSSEKLKKYMEEAENDLTTIGCWGIFLMWCFQKLKSWFPISTSLPTTMTESQPTRSTSPSTLPSQPRMTTTQIRRIHREVIVRTLRRINQEREERDEELISIEAIEAFQNALLEDQEVFEGFPEEGEGRPSRSPGATQVEIDACLKRLPNEQDDCECIICLTELDSERKEMLRVLPCNHTFHACCIDKWFDKSTQCPICKGSIRNETE